jgi:hypothetical protein
MRRWGALGVAGLLLAGCGDRAWRSIPTARDGTLPSARPPRPAQPEPSPAAPAPSPSVPVGRSRLEWTPGPSDAPAARFRVYVAAVGGSFSLAAETAEPVVALSALGLVPGRQYRVRVTAVGADRLESAPSAELLFLYQP